MHYDITFIIEWIYLWRLKRGFWKVSVLPCCWWRVQRDPLTVLLHF